MVTVTNDEYLARYPERFAALLARLEPIADGQPEAVWSRQGARPSLLNISNSLAQRVPVRVVLVPEIGAACACTAWRTGDRI